MQCRARIVCRTGPLQGLILGCCRGSFRQLLLGIQPGVCISCEAGLLVCKGMEGIRGRWGRRWDAGSSAWSRLRWLLGSKLSGPRRLGNSALGRRGCDALNSAPS